MTEVFSTGIAMTFSAADKKKQQKDAAKREQKPKKSREEIAASFKEKLVNVINRDGGQYVEFPEGIGLLVAGAEQNNHYYFVWLDRDRNLRFTNSKETFHLVREVPISLSITDYLFRNEPECLVDIVERFFKNEELVDASDKYTLVGMNFGTVKLRNNKKDKKDKKNNQKKNNNANANKTEDSSEEAPKKKKRSRSRNRNKNNAEKKQA